MYCNVLIIVIINALRQIRISVQSYESDKIARIKHTE